MAVAELGNKEFDMVGGIVKLFYTIPNPWSVPTNAPGAPPHNFMQRLSNCQCPPPAKQTVNDLNAIPQSVQDITGCLAIF